MTCPYCGKEMLDGFIQSRDGLAWRPKQAAIAALSMFGKNVVILANSHTPLKGAALQVSLCHTCKIIVGCLKND